MHKIVPTLIPVKGNQQQEDLGYKNMQFRVFYAQRLLEPDQTAKHLINNTFYIMRIPNYFSLLLICLLFLTGNSALAETEKKVLLKDFTLTTSNTQLLLFASVQNDKQKELERALHSGIPMQFTFLIKLIQIQNNWPDKELISMDLTHTLKYDTLKERYLLTIEEQRSRKIAFTELSKAMQRMNDLNGLNVIELAKLQPETTYEIQLKAELYKKTLPMNLHHVIPFISLGDVETDWHSIEFTY